MGAVHKLDTALCCMQQRTGDEEGLEKDNVICLFSGSVLVLSALFELTHLNSLKASGVDIVILNF